MKWIIAVLIVCLLTLQYRLWIGEGSIAEVVYLRDQIGQQEAEIARLRERNRILALEVDDLKTGYDTVEERARSQMGMVKEGETFYMIVDKAPAKSSPSQ